MKTTTTQTRPEIDFPAAEESIDGAHYSFRIAAPAAAKAVDVSIDKGPWQACRHSIGYWWYDWSSAKAGAHEVIARVPGANGRFVVSAPRRFVVGPKA